MSDSNKKIIKLISEAEAFRQGDGEVVVYDHSRGDEFSEMVKTLLRCDPDEVVLGECDIDQSIALIAQLGPSVKVHASPVKLPVHQQVAALCIIQDGINDGHAVADIFNALAEMRFGGVQLLWETCACEFKAGNTERAFSFLGYAFDEDSFAAIRIGQKLGRQDFGIDTAIRLLSMKPIVTTMPL